MTTNIAIPDGFQLDSSPTQMQIVTDANFLNNVWKIIYSLVKNNVTDPNGRVTGTKWIYATYPDEHMTRTDYPHITVASPEISRFYDTSFGYTSPMVIQATVPITIFALRTDQVENLADQIMLAVDQNTETLNMQNIQRHDLPGLSHQVYLRNDIKIHTCTIQYNFYYTYGE